MYFVPQDMFTRHRSIKQGLYRSNITVPDYKILRFVAELPKSKINTKRDAVVVYINALVAGASIDKSVLYDDNYEDLNKLRDFLIYYITKEILN